MCGICGKLDLQGNGPVDQALVRRMTDAVHHRGPDDEGFYFFGPIGLGHRRLSIIDLNTGQQPVSNENKTVWIVFNGEIYNYQELREDLVRRGHTFRTASDTEVIVHLYEEYGEACLEKLRGMFAFAIWDENNKSLFLARDRVGIKPLYYCQAGSSLLFGSELKSILIDPSVPREVDLQVIDRFLTFRYTPGPETALKGIYKLQPGHFLLAKSGSITIHQYWDLTFAPQARHGNNFGEDLSDLLRDTVRGHMISDVPVGVLLSGGVDSTAVLSYASELTTERIHTFTIGFAGEGIVDERPYARLAGKRFETNHFETSISAREFESFLPRYVWHMEEPVCEPPAVALYFVSQLARRHVKVLLSGEGGDEGFAGYPEYRNFPIFEGLKSALGPFRRPVAAAIASLNKIRRVRRLEKYSSLMNVKPEVYYLGRTSTPTDGFTRSLESLYTSEVWQNIDHGKSLRFMQPLFQKTAAQKLLNQMLYVDTKTWLPDDLLIKADKITMANSVELRVPFLDHRILEFAASLPLREKVYGRSTKHLLKKVLSGRVPHEILERKKAGFPVPYDAWLRRDLKEMVYDTLMSRPARERGFFKPKAIEQLIEDNSAGKNRSKQVFSLLTLELWSQTFLDSNPNLN